MTTIAEQLAEAHEAYHALQVGKSTVTVRDSNGEEITFARANVTRLAAYIRELKGRLVAPRPVLSVRFNTSKGI